MDHNPFFLSLTPLPQSEAEILSSLRVHLTETAGVREGAMPKTPSTCDGRNVPFSFFLFYLRRGRRVLEWFTVVVRGREGADGK